eukprot:gb/GEZN01002630.1/.p1 GENE.gb/GEZN01002630.1/~~gb/GEZN01002630.1/.p1  ORF type:complete len:635 (+),score=77.71 gb/GEZN01002630.1/:164-2068(+)
MADSQPEDPADNVGRLLEGLSNEKPQVRLQSFQQLGQIASALGPARTRDEFVPYLMEFADCEEDETLLILAKQLGQFVRLVGGPDHIPVLIPILEHIAAEDAQLVRDQAIEALCQIMKAVPSSTITKVMFPVVSRLARSQWYTARQASCGLFGQIYPSVSAAHQKELRGLYSHLAADTTPMVRRSIVLNAGKFAQRMQLSDVKTHLLPLLSQLAVDEQDSVRLLTVEALVTIAKILAQEKDNRDVYKLLLALASDKSWRVRCVAADKFAEVCAAISRRDLESKTMQAPVHGVPVEDFARLLQDSEPEVRTSAANRVGGLARLCGAGLTIRVLCPPLKNMVLDSSSYVRAAVGSILMDVSAVLERRDVVDHMLPLFLTLLKDSDSDVRLNVIGKLAQADQVIGNDVLTAALLPAIVTLASDPKWRIRVSVIQYIPNLAKQLGRETFETKLNDLSMTWMGDHFYSVREAAIKNLTDITKVFGVPWAMEQLVPKVIKFFGHHKSYFYRMTALYAVQNLCRTVGPEGSKQSLMPLVLELARDPVPNIRINVVRTLQHLSAVLDEKDVKDQVHPALDDLTKDSDDDVVFFAGVARHTPPPTTDPSLISSSISPVDTVLSSSHTSSSAPVPMDTSEDGQT